MGELDVHGLYRSVTMEELLRYRMYLSEELERLLSSSKDHQCRVVFDGRGFSSKHLYKPFVSFFLETQQIDLDFYPENVHGIYVISNSKIVQFGYSLVKHIFDERTKNKIHFGPLEAIHEFIDKDRLPSFYGGTLSMEEAKAQGFIFGGTIPKEYYRGADPSFQSVFIPAGKKFSLKVDVVKPNSQIVWDFVTVENDCGFGLFFQPSNSKKDDKNRETLIEITRYPCSDDNVNGTYECNKTGCYVLIWDNSYSWVRGKALKYKADVFVPQDDKNQEDTSQSKSQPRASEVTSDFE